MKYRWERNGRQFESEIKFDPLSVGFEFVEITGCCIKFQKKLGEDDVWQIRVKNDSGLLFLQHCDDEESGRYSYNKLRMARPIASHQEFLGKIEKWNIF